MRVRRWIRSFAQRRVDTMPEIKFQSVGYYRGIEMLCSMMSGKLVFVAWMDKFYSSDNPAALYEVIDLWWKLRRN